MRRSKGNRVGMTMPHLNGAAPMSLVSDASICKYMQAPIRGIKNERMKRLITEFHLQFEGSVKA